MPVPTLFDNPNAFPPPDTVDPPDTPDYSTTDPLGGQADSEEYADVPAGLSVGLSDMDKPASEIKPDTDTKTGKQEVQQEALEAQDAPPPEPGKQISGQSAEQEAQDTAEPEEFSTDILAQAAQYGFSSDEAKSFGTADNLQRAMVALDRRASAWGRQQIAAQQKPATQQANQQTNGQLPQFAQQTQPAQQTQQTQQQLEKFKVDLDPAEFDEPTINFINKLNDHYHGLAASQADKIRQLTEFLVAQHEAQQRNTGQSEAEENARFERDMDSFFAGLGDEYSDVYGKEPMRLLSADNPKSIARIKLVEEMDALKYSDAHHRRSPSTDAEVRERALRLLHQDKFTATARKEILGKIKERQSQTIARPSTSHRAKPLSGEEKAIQRANEFALKHGLGITEVPQEV